MNNLQKLINKRKNQKLTENGDIAYKTTGDNLTDLFFMTPYFEKHLDEVHIGTSNREKVFAMYIRDPRYGQGRRDLGRELMSQAEVLPKDIAEVGRYDDLWHIPTDENLDYLQFQIYTKNDELAKKWLPRLTSKDKAIAKELCKMWHLSEKEYRKLIKTQTTEYKLSYATPIIQSNLDKLFNKKEYYHPLVNEIKFEQVPSLAMKKYLHTFSTREDLKDRFNEYMQEVKANKKKINVTTTNVIDAKDVVSGDWTTQNYKENKEILGKKIVEKATIGVSINAIVILDTSGSMGWQKDKNSLLWKAEAIAHAISINSTYAKNQLISFSSRPRLMTIEGDTLEEQYKSMYTGDCSNTDFGAVMKLLKRLNKFPKYLIVISDMEFDEGSNQSKKETMQLFKENGADTKIIWWNLNDRNKTISFQNFETIIISIFKEVFYTTLSKIILYKIYLQLLRLIENDFNMSTYIDKILKDYCKKINKSIDF